LLADRAKEAKKHLEYYQNLYQNLTDKKWQGNFKSNLEKTLNLLASSEKKAEKARQEALEEIKKNYNLDSDSKNEKARHLAWARKNAREKLEAWKKLEAREKDFDFNKNPTIAELKWAITTDAAVAYEKIADTTILFENDEKRFKDWADFAKEMIRDYLLIKELVAPTSIPQNTMLNMDLTLNNSEIQLSMPTPWAAWITMLNGKELWTTIGKIGNIMLIPMPMDKMFKDKEMIPDQMTPDKWKPVTYDFSPPKDSSLQVNLSADVDKTTNTNTNTIQIQIQIK